MICETHEFDANLAAVCGDDAGLRSELLASFRDSLDHQVDLLGRARCDGNWMVAAERLRGLGAGFHAPVLMGLAERALEGAPGDPAVLRSLRAFAESFAARD